MTSETTKEKPRTPLFTGGAQTEWAKARLDTLRTEDAQFIATMPDPDVIQAKQQPGLRLSQIVQIIMEGYAARPAIGHRARELVTDPDSGRTSQRLLNRFETCSFGELWARIQATAAEWHGDSRNPVRPGDFGAVLGFASADYATMQLANLHLGVVNVPLQANAPTDQHVAIIAETEPRVLAASIELIDAAVDAILGGAPVPRLVVFDYEPRDDSHRERFAAAVARLLAAACPTVVDTLREVITRGEALPRVAPHIADDPDPLTWLFYTSGTTGTPKGAMYTEEDGAQHLPLRGGKARNHTELHADEPRGRLRLSLSGAGQWRMQLLLAEERPFHAI